MMRLFLIVVLIGVLALGDGTARRLRTSSFSITPAVTALVVLIGMLMMWTRFNLRPELLSYLFFVLLVRGADRHYRRPAPASPWRDPSLWRLFGLVVVWAQCHGFAALAPVILLLRVAVRPLDRISGQDVTDGDPNPRSSWSLRALWAPVLLGLLALLLTPNHWRGLIFPWRVLQQLTSETADLSTTVSELVPLLATPNALGLTLTVFKWSLVWGVLFGALAWGRVSALRLVLFVVAALAALTSQRNLALYGLVFVLLHTGVPGDWPGPWWRRILRWDHWPRSPQIVRGIVALGLVVGGFAWWAPAIVSNDYYLAEGVGRRFGGGTTPATYPRQAGLALSSAYAKRTFANLDAAAFLLGTTQAQPFIDGRTEAYPMALWSDYGRLRSGGSPALTLLARARVSAVVLALRSGAFNQFAIDLLASPAWRPVAADAGGMLFVPRLGNEPQSDQSVLATAARQLLANPVADPTRWADLCLAASDLFKLTGDFPAMLQALRTGLDARPDHPLLNHNLGVALLDDGQFAAALPHFQRALQVNGRLAGSALNLGVCQLRLQQTTAAITSFARAVAIAPDRVSGWVNLALALHRDGQTAQAIDALEKAVALQPDESRLQGLLHEWRRNRR